MEVVTDKPTTKAVPKGYKRTEVGVIPEDWEVCKQKEVVEYINGRAYSKDEWESKGVPVIRLQNLTGSGDKYYYSTLNLPEKNYMYNGDLIFMWSASFGPYIWRGPKAIFHYHIWKINCDEDLVDKVFYYFKLLELTEALKQNTSGSTMLHLTKTSMEEYKIALPPTLKEQQAIADTLSDVDALIAELDALIEKKQQIKKGAMQQLLTPNSSGQAGKKRLPGFDGEWEEKKLGDLLTVMHGKSQKSVASESGRYPILGTSGQIGKAISYLYDKPSVLIGRKGTIDRPQYMDKPFWTIDTLFYTDVNEKAIAKFLYYRFLLIDWTSYNEASGVPSLNSSTIENIEILFPKGIEEQKAIAGILSNMDAEIRALQSKRAKYEQIKQGMMQELLTGKTRLV